MTAASRRTTPKKAKAPASIDDLLAEAAPREVTVRVLLRQDLLARHAELDADLVDAVEHDRVENAAPKAPVIAEKIQALEAEIEEAKRPFTFRCIGKKAWADLIAEHPPTREQAQQLRVDHNPDTFPSEAIAASCVSPEMNAGQARALEERLNLSQWQQLWSGCLAANVGTGDTPKSVAAGVILQVSGRSATTAVSEGSLAASSSDE